MAIYTRKGDAGTTSLVGGERVSKDSPRVKAYGDVDELISYLGLIRAEAQKYDAVLRRVQIHLMNVSARLACDGDSVKLKALDPAETIFLESEIDKMADALPAQRAFILPGAPAVSSICHIARTVCRRAERSAVGIEHRSPEDEKAIAYINRLSDYLFTLARQLCFDAGVEDDFWLP